MSIFAGVAETAITPPVGVEMLEPRGVPTTAIREDLYLRVLALGDGETTVFIATLDLLGLEPGLVQQMQRAVFNRTGIGAERLMLLCSHNHSAPVTLACCPDTQEKRHRAWEEQLVQAMAETVERAGSRLSPAALGVGRGDVQIGVNRRLAQLTRAALGVNHAGPVAPWVDVLRVDCHDTSPAILFSHAAHPVTVHDTGTEINPDYPGAAVRQVRQRLDGHPIAMFAQGCAGNINVVAWRGGFEAAEQVGTVLGNAAADAAQQALPVQDAILQVASHTVELPFETIEPVVAKTILARVQESIAATSGSSGDGRVSSDQCSLLNWAEQMAARARSADAERGLPCQIQIFVLGPEVALVALGHEPFIEYQLFLQANSPFRHTFVFGYANACSSYIPTADAYYLGGYESHGAHKLFGLPRLLPQSEQILKTACLNLLAELRSRYL